MGVVCVLCCAQLFLVDLRLKMLTWKRTFIIFVSVASTAKQKQNKSLQLIQVSYYKTFFFKALNFQKNCLKSVTSLEELKRLGILSPIYATWYFNHDMLQINIWLVCICVFPAGYRSALSGSVTDANQPRQHFKRTLRSDTWYIAEQKGLTHLKI